MNKKTVRDIDVSGKRVLVRVDFNVPLDEKTGAISDDSRIRAALPTIDYLREKKAKVILMSHLGRPKGKVVDDLRLGIIAQRLAQILSKQVKVTTDCIGSEAEKAVAAVKYPPDGSRGVGLYRAQGFGDNFEEYRNTLNKESLVIAQIEHQQAVENIDDILTVSGIDGVMIGPYDISGSLGVIGELDHPKVKEARAKVLAAAKASNKAAGIHVVEPSTDEVRDRIKEGFNFIAYSTDAIMLNSRFREDARELMSYIDKSK